jgi:hypothetical protein
VDRRAPLIVVAWAACAGWGGVAARRREPLASSTRGTLVVPHAAAPIALDGDTDDPGWVRAPGPARSGPFVDATGAPARPYAEARLLRGDGVLYVLLYAADEDVRATDRFRLTFAGEGAYAVAVTADGRVHDESPAGWRSGMHVSREIDGTLDDPRDLDEEWALELALPLASIGLRGARNERVAFHVTRFDAAGESEAPVAALVFE